MHSNRFFRVGLSRLIIGAAVVSLVLNSKAEVALHPLFCDGMVLQRDAEAPVWGWASPGETITIEFGGARKATTAGANGKWVVRLSPMPASNVPRVMTVSGAGGSRNEIGNVVVGDVWLCGGQSNMEAGVGDARNPKQEQQEAKYPLIRVATIGWSVKPTLQDKPTINQGKWLEATSENILGLTAVGYFFGRELHQKLDVPIGLIHASKGGTPAESWMPKDSLLADPELAWTADPALYDEYTRPGELYNAMIYPLAPYRIRGAIWYQGENNLFRGWLYRKTLPSLIAEWRKLWDVKKPEDFPFGVVQLAGQGTAFNFAFLDSIWAETRESQEIVSREPGNGLAVTLDLSVDNYDIHPKNKQEIGRRLSFWALNRVYGKTSVEYQGPVFASEKIEGSKIRLSFNPTGGGLVSRGGPPSFFTIAGADQQFKWGTAVIEGNTIVVSSPEVPNPVAVRYAWSHGPCTANKSQIANVYGQNGLPLGCFRTDNWKLESAPDVTYPTTVLPAGVVGQRYSRSLATATARGAAITYALVPGARMPSGFNLDEKGQVTGAPAAPGTYVFKVRATASSAAVRDADVIVTVQPKGGPAVWTMAYDANGATAGSVPSWQIRNGDAPLRLASNTGGLKRTGHIFQGWNTAPDGSGETFAEGASCGKNGDAVLYANWGAITVEYADQTLPDAVVGKPYKATAANAKAGDAHLQYEKMSGKLPTGLNFDFPFGTLSGTPAEAGTFSIVVKAKTGTGQFREAKVTVTVKTSHAAK